MVKNDTVAAIAMSVSVPDVSVSGSVSIGAESVSSAWVREGQGAASHQNYDQACEHDTRNLYRNIDIIIVLFLFYYTCLIEF